MNPHVAAKERKPVAYPAFSLTGHEKTKLTNAGKVEMLAIKS